MGNCNLKAEDESSSMSCKFMFIIYLILHLLTNYGESIYLKSFFVTLPPFFTLI